MELNAIFMFPALLAAIMLGVHVSVALILVSFFFGFLAFGDVIFLQMYGMVVQTGSNFVLAAIPLFVLMGAFLERSGVAERLFQAIQIWVVRLPGGLAVATLCMCAVFAASAGIAGAVEVVVGLMAIPAMRKFNYDRGLVSGTICAGGSLGTIIPPSVTIVVYASIGQTSVSELFAAAMIPGFILAGMFMAYVVLRAILRPQDAPRPDLAEFSMPLGRKLLVTAQGLLPALSLVFAVLGSILMGIASPTEAAAVGVVGAFLLACLYRTMSFRVLYESFASTVQITAMIMLIVLGGTLFTGIFAVSGGGRMLSLFIENADIPPQIVVVVFLAIAFIAGFALDWVSIVMICVPIFTPIIKSIGIDPTWFAVMFLIVVQTSYLTPPMAPAVFYLKSIAPPDFTYGHMYRGVMPFVMIEIMLLGLLALFPELATWLPKVLYGAGWN